LQAAPALRAVVVGEVLEGTAVKAETVVDKGDMAFGNEDKAVVEAMSISLLSDGNSE
jgi:hypothetical protein